MNQLHKVLTLNIHCPQYGFLIASDIFQNNLNNQMVIMFAKETKQGMVFRLQLDIGKA